MLKFSLCIFLSAFLLFQIQPMIGRIILPWYGGTPAVWSTVMLFFQVLLTAGYAYAYWLIRRIHSKSQSVIHGFLIVSAVALQIVLSFYWTSPITPDPGLKPVNVEFPILEIFKLLTVTVGLPYFILAANGPLMQAWFSRLHPSLPYARLYSISNIGSLLGLIVYPVLIEPTLTLRGQGWAWAGGFLLFGSLAVCVGIQQRRSSHPFKPEVESAVKAPSPSAALIALWIILSATASLFLLSVTNQISQEVAVIPFLWVLPLTIYLLTFILTFSGSGYSRNIFSGMFIVSLAATLFVLLNATALHVYWQVLAYCLMLFSACMLCHGELYLLRPPGEYLTTFYLMVSIGGALGGVFVSLVAPVIFNGYWEFFVGLAMALAVLLTILRENGNTAARARFVFKVFLSVTGMLAVVSTTLSGAIFSKRNFYGVIRVRQIVPAGSTEAANVMSHGITIHGLQFIVSPELRKIPTTYYVPEAGVGLAILNHPKYGHQQHMRVGLLGLGVGTLASYGQAGDEYRLYEINPAVVDLAAGGGNYFSFLSDSQADISIILGDARISLERELAQGHRQNFDVLVLDAFSSDSIPVHLVTKEAFALYLEHLAPDGIIAAHITNLHLDLQPVFWQLAKYYGLNMARVNYGGDSRGGYVSHWILLSRDPALLENPAIEEHTVDLTGYSTDLKLWTDDYSNLFQILK